MHLRTRSLTDHSIILINNVEDFFSHLNSTFERASNPKVGQAFLPALRMPSLRKSLRL